MHFTKSKIQDDCSCPLLSWDFITSGRSGGDEYGVSSNDSKAPLSSLKQNTFIKISICGNNENEWKNPEGNFFLDDYK